MSVTVLPAHRDAATLDGAAAERFARRVARRHAVVAVVGLGHAGLPVAYELARTGFTVRGVDVDAAKVAALRAGRSYLPDLDDHDLQAVTGRLRANTSPAQVRTADAVVVCVPTPLAAGGQADLSAVASAFDAVAPHLRAGTLVVLQSTVPPGTTCSEATRLEAATGLALGRELFVAFAPERINPADRAGWTVSNTPRVVGGVTTACTQRAVALLEALCGHAVPVSSPLAAEMAKLVENTFRLVNVSLANELSDVCHDLGVSAREVIDAAATKPFGFLAHRPGPGIGGDCIPVDPVFLLSDPRRVRVPMPVAATAYRRAIERPAQVIARVDELLRQRNRRLAGARVLVLGVAYKANVDDVRNAPALAVIDGLLHRGALVRYCDPLVPTVTVAGHLLASEPWCDATLAASDCAVLVTPHADLLDAVDWSAAPLVLDTRNVLPLKENVAWL